MQVKQLQVKVDQLSGQAAAQLAELNAVLDNRVAGNGQLRACPRQFDYWCTRLQCLQPAVWCSKRCMR